ncbi:MAG: hypothetical protein IIY16_03415, partial [Oscillospiraceae bacterium]|nr:hypothetical protein [Oscillospiraceae bacterium]
CSCWFVENHGLVLEFISTGKAAPGGAVAHIAIEVCGLENLVAELKEKGIIAADAEITAMPDFFPSGSRDIFFTGPAGEEIELYELRV